MAMLLVACSPGEQAGRPLTTWADACPSGVTCGAGGMLIQGELRFAGECLWLIDAAGREVAIYWPPSFYVDFSTGSIKDSRGVTVARSGDMIRASGSGPDLSGEGDPLAVPESCGRPYAVSINRDISVRSQ